jgi:hypothetical protein
MRVSPGAASRHKLPDINHIGDDADSGVWRCGKQMQAVDFGTDHALEVPIKHSRLVGWDHAVFSPVDPRLGPVTGVLDRSLVVKGKRVGEVEDDGHISKDLLRFESVWRQAKPIDMEKVVIPLSEIGQ